MIHIFTITARNYLSLALTLGDSVARQHPEARFTIFVADGLEEVAVSLKSPLHQIRDGQQVFAPEVQQNLSFKYNITEYCTALKPAIFRSLFSTESDTDLVYYMDPDTHLYSRLDPITAATPGKTLYLAPHLIDCRLADDHPYPEYRHLWEGIFNLGFCAIRRSESSARIIDWWDTRLREYCYADHLDGLHTDQKWMDYAPVFFRDELEVVTNYGVNVAHWNIAERPLSEDDGRFFANQQPLIFFHFSGFDFKNELLTKHSPAEEQLAYFTPTIRRLSQDYRAAVKANGFDQFIKIPYAFATFADGTPITQQVRRLYRELTKSRVITLPFATEGEFFGLVRDANLLDTSPEARNNYSKATVQNLDGKMKTVAGAMRFLLRIVGIKRYVQLTKLASYLGRFENHAFLLRDKS